MEKERCVRCRFREVRTIETETENRLAADKLCNECGRFARVKQLRDCADAVLPMAGAKGKADMIRIFLATMLPTKAELVDDIGPRVNLAEHLAEKAGKALAELASFIHGDDWVPDPPKLKSKPWV